MNQKLHLVAHVGGRGILIDATKVDSVVDLPAVVPTPGAPRTIRGLAALRSRVATVIDTHAVLDLPPADQGAPGRGVVTSVDGHLYAIVVDTLEDVAHIALSPPPPGLALQGAWSLVTAVAEGASGTLVALDLERLVQRATAAE